MDDLMVFNSDERFDCRLCLWIYEEAYEVIVRSHILVVAMWMYSQSS